MRLPVFILMSFLVFNLHARPKSFDGDAFIQSCLKQNLTATMQQTCLGYFYGIASKTDQLLNPSSQENVLQRAISTRMPADNYGTIKRRQLGVYQVCLPANLQLKDFQSIITTFKANTRSKQLSVIQLADLFAQSYRCSKADGTRS